MTPREARLGLGAFAVLASGLAANMLVMQGGKAPAVSMARPDRNETAVSDRMRRLALPSPQETASVGRPAVIGTDLKRRNGPATPAKPAEATQSEADSVETIRAIQRELQQRGYEIGTPDGVPGLITRASIMAWEHDNGLQPTGEANDEVLKRILVGASAADLQNRGASERRAGAEAVIKTVQQTLSGLGYNTGKVDGRLGEDTVRAIRDFESDSGMPETGRISGALVARLAKVTANGRLPGR